MMAMMVIGICSDGWILFRHLCLRLEAHSAISSCATVSAEEEPPSFDEKMSFRSMVGACLGWHLYQQSLSLSKCQIFVAVTACCPGFSLGCCELEMILDGVLTNVHWHWTQHGNQPSRQRKDGLEHENKYQVFTFSGLKFPFSHL